ncbi:MAG TPA: biotin carboxylase N-terminal domain-containing protein [Pseudonocardia sp.]
MPDRRPDAGQRTPAIKRIRSLLIANRGEIAVRIARTARDMGITTIAVYSDIDADATHVDTCDQAIALHGATPAESYLDAAKLLAAARAAGADAIHPGYGFLSENATFAAAVLDAGLVWVGPHPESITAMGDKIAAKRLMEQHGVPVLPSVVVADDTDLRGVAEELTFPIIVKASAGGGGKGMGVVDDQEHLVEAVHACRREAAAAFGDDRVFLERFVPEPRHIEVQIFGDQHGRIVHLYERECSVQRRHQKVIEEAPAPRLDPELRAELCAAAVRAGEALGYDNAGTVEFVVGADGSVAFLEINTRIQVEHPVTEAITGLDLVRWQLLVAEGRPLPLNQQQVVCRGHAIEARLYAETPGHGYLPAAGAVHELEQGAVRTARWDSGVGSGDVVSPFYDPMLAKVICHAETRDEAARCLEKELRTSHVHGPATNRDLLCAVLTHPEFLAGAVTTGFLDQHFPTDADRSFPPRPRLVADAATAAALVAERARSEDTSFPSGWRNVRSADQTIRFTVPGGGEAFELRYWRERDGSWTVHTAARESRVLRATRPRPGFLTLTIDDRRMTLRVSSTPAGDGTSWEVTGVDGHVSLHEHGRYPLPAEAEVPGATRAPMHGTVLAMHVAEGDAVGRGDLLCVVEAMKMEHRIAAPHAGTVTAVNAEKGDQVEHDQILVVISEVEPGSGRPAANDA